MASIAHKDFLELLPDGSNYLTWAMDTKIYLSSKGYVAAIQEPNLNDDAPEVTDAVKFSSLHIMRHHLHPDLKNEYMMEEDPRALWVALKDRYEQQKAVILPEAQQEWSLLRLMDFKSVSDYNSAVHKICAKLRFCDQPINDATMIEKTLSTFLPANRILQQQYRNRAYVKYSDLIYNLLQAEKHDELLTRNHQMRPVGATPLPDVHFIAQKNKKFEGKKKKLQKKVE